jgi:hypothetical protein
MSNGTAKESKWEKLGYEIVECDTWVEPILGLIMLRDQSGKDRVIRIREKILGGEVIYWLDCCTYLKEDCK